MKTSKPATEKQIALLRKKGYLDAETRDLTMSAASALIDATLEAGCRVPTTSPVLDEKALSDLLKDTKEETQTLNQEARRLWHSGANRHREASLEQGKALLIWKKIVPHGKQAQLYRLLGINERTAQSYTATAKFHQDVQQYLPETLSRLKHLSESELNQTDKTVADALSRSGTFVSSRKAVQATIENVKALRAQKNSAMPSSEFEPQISAAEEQTAAEKPIAKMVQDRPAPVPRFKRVKIGEDAHGTAIYDNRLESS